MTNYYLINSFFLEVVTKTCKDSSSESEDDDLVAGIFKVKKKVSVSKANYKRSIYHQCDCSKESLQMSIDDINIDELEDLIKDCFVTGKWGASEDAQQLLDEDGRSHFLKFLLAKSQQQTNFLKDISLIS